MEASQMGPKDPGNKYGVPLIKVTSFCSITMSNHTTLTHHTHVPPICPSNYPKENTRFHLKNK